MVGSTAFYTIAWAAIPVHSTQPWTVQVCRQLSCVSFSVLVLFNQPCFAQWHIVHGSVYSMRNQYIGCFASAEYMSVGLDLCQHAQLNYYSGSTYFFCSVRSSLPLESSHTLGIAMCSFAEGILTQFIIMLIIMQMFDKQTCISSWSACVASLHSHWETHIQTWITSTKIEINASHQMLTHCNVETTQSTSIHYIHKHRYQARMCATTQLRNSWINTHQWI